MDKNIKNMTSAGGGGSQEVQMAPFRSMDDFILAKSRFQAPDFNNKEKYFNRIVSNLLYYQTNYGISAIALFTLVGIMNPHKMLCGIIIMGIIFAGGFYLKMNKEEVMRFRNSHPSAFNGGLFGLGIFVIFQTGYIVTFIFGIVLPMCFILIHASYRMRNVKNKLANVTEAFGVAKKTPMGIFLQEIGVEIDLKYIS